MAIKQYIHGDGKDYQLWGNVGRLIVNPAVQEKLGIHVTSLPDDIWWVSMTHKSETKGFACARIMKNGNCHLRYFYMDSDGDLGLKALIMGAINYAKEQGCKQFYTNWHKDSSLLQEIGFTPIPKKTGKFCRWEYPIKGDA